jgi:cytochrome oxidase Cu insertion factor (SCO1/SenC/PrrC family)
MAYPVEGRRVYLLKLLRRFATTAAATAAGVAHAVMHPNESLVELKPGDLAPDFSLPGSDGRTYRLKDLAGRPVVVAWFPKAFTGG